MLGAGGFTVGWDDTFNHYTFVDIDPILKEVAEKYFLPSKLPSNKKVVATSARAFLHRTSQHYDLILVDLYSNVHSIPAESITREFLLDIKRLLKPDSIFIANVVSSPNYNEIFSMRYYNTFASVFPVFDRHVATSFNGWSRDLPVTNTLYIYYHNDMMTERSMYRVHQEPGTVQ